jgi:anaerobic selenocysteine-containing dehydrogenase
MDRRSFIKLTAVSGTTAALAGCGNPDYPLIRFVPAEDIIPGQAIWKPSVCPLCPSGCGLTVRVMDADADVVRDGKAGVVQILAAKKLEGAPDHPVNRGGLCARGQAAIQVTYHPDRITQPLKRSGNRGDGKYEAISWDDALAEVVAKLNELASTGNQRAVTYLARPGSSQRAGLIGQFLRTFGAPPPVTYELFSDDVLRRANALSFGREQLPTFDLANTRYLLSFGADFLGTWNSPVSHSRSYGEMRQGRPGIRGSFVQVEARMSQTGASADEWVPARPGTEGVLALGLANVIIGMNLRPASAGGRAASLIQGWPGSLPSPAEVETITGVAAARVERLAREFVQRRPSLAVVGGPPLAHTNGLFTALAVNALNVLAAPAELDGSPGEPTLLSTFIPQMSTAGNADSTPPALRQVAADLSSGAEGAARVLIVDGANPVFTAPRAWKLREAFDKVPFIVSFGSFLDETSSLADLILPDHTFLESWTDAMPESGSSGPVASVAGPVMMPLYNTRATADVVLEIARRLATPIDLSAQTFEEVLSAAFTRLPAMTEGGDAWVEAQEKGFWSGELPAALQTRPAPIEGNASAASFVEPEFDGAADQYPFHFLPYPSNQFLDGSTAHLPWLQEMPDPLTSAMWSSWVEINPATAARLGISEGDIVEVTSPQGALRTAAVVSPGIAPDVVAMPAGQGHTTFTRYASGRGENPVDLLADKTVAQVGSLAWAATRVKIARIGEEDGRLILFAGGMREHVGHGR